MAPISIVWAGCKERFREAKSANDCPVKCIPFPKVQDEAFVMLLPRTLVAAACLLAALPSVFAEETAPRIVNIVNFIRGVEPREPMDLVAPVVEQIKLAKKHGLPSTFLVQYDAMIKPEFADLLKKELGPEDEIGAWIEVVQPQVEAAGLKWRGRFPWDWHTDVGFHGRVHA